MQRAKIFIFNLITVFFILFVALCIMGLLTNIFEAIE